MTVGLAQLGDKPREVIVIIHVVPGRNERDVETVLLSLCERFCHDRRRTPGNVLKQFRVERTHPDQIIASITAGAENGVTACIFQVLKCSLEM
jgi:hypothetical protein